GGSHRQGLHFIAACRDPAKQEDMRAGVFQYCERLGRVNSWCPVQNRQRDRSVSSTSNVRRVRELQVRWVNAYGQSVRIGPNGEQYVRAAAGRQRAGEWRLAEPRLVTAFACAASEEDGLNLRLAQLPAKDACLVDGTHKGVLEGDGGSSSQPEVHGRSRRENTKILLLHDRAV